MNDVGVQLRTNSPSAVNASARSRLKIRKGSTTDASKQPDGSYKRESRKTNRGRGGAKRA